MKVLGIIPARYKSSRYPGKPLVKILGKPLVIHVAERAVKALGMENVIIATEDERIRSVVQEFGFQCQLTSDEHLTGTDRLWEVAQKNEADIFVNIQGDEPMVNPADILAVAKEKENFPEYVINGMHKLGPDEDPHSPHLPKLVFNKHKELVYMSRLAIPGVKIDEKPTYYKQVCIYAFSKNELKAFGECKTKSSFERFEDIEILRFFDLGIKVKMVETRSVSLAVDIPDDVSKVERALSK